ncbi:hypothetical protein T4E_1272 [Trichinella pseudospiralis]|uniref:Uncharacterized protein n=1 Tax=Trichinella pseudospiralis TaxID=6337 RepID=A0A0V0YAP3_TRIPS|nr:hypothetical protein T4E_1272 [Trichinella pseudospiralis]
MSGNGKYSLQVNCGGGVRRDGANKLTSEIEVTNDRVNSGRITNMLSYEA